MILEKERKPPSFFFSSPLLLLFLSCLISSQPEVQTGSWSADSFHQQLPARGTGEGVRGRILPVQLTEALRSFPVKAPDPPWSQIPSQTRRKAECWIKGALHWFLLLKDRRADLCVRMNLGRAADSLKTCLRFYLFTRLN